jgi:glycosyltransferase involved in cell wall biosynthesis
MKPAESPERLIVLAPTPPPVFGHSVLTLSVLASLRRLGLLAAHIDIRDDRSLANLNRLDLENVRLGLVAAWRLIGAMRRHPGAGVYVQISQGFWGFLRDALWIWLAHAGRRRTYAHLLGGRFGDFHAQSGPLMRRLIEVTLRRTHRLWVLTPALRSCFDGLAPPDRVRVLQAVVAEPIVADDRPRPTAPGGFRILFLSNLREGKGHETLLEALVRLGPRAAGWELRLVGECDQATRRRVDGVAARLDPAVAVVVTGALTGRSKSRELAAADLFAFPTTYRNEGQPLVLLEALAAGLPIVTTRHRGIPDTVGEREALLIEPGDSDALAAALLRLAEDEELRVRLGRAARTRYEERYAPESLDRSLSELLAR